MERDELKLTDPLGVSAGLVLICIVPMFHFTIPEIAPPTKANFRGEANAEAHILEGATFTVPERPLCPAHCCPCCR